MSNLARRLLATPLSTAIRQQPLFQPVHHQSRSFFAHTMAAGAAQKRKLSGTAAGAADKPQKKKQEKQTQAEEKKQPAHSLEDPPSHGIARDDELVTGMHEWKTRVPYRIHDAGEEFEAKLHASCHCGKVKYQLSRDEPLASKLCHCTTCQKQHAAPFQWAAIFHKEDINFTHGHHNLEWYDPTDKSIEHKVPCKVRCNYCHSPIMDEGRNMILLFPTLINLESDRVKDSFKPRLHMFYGERVMDIPDGLPKWTGLNDTSELIEDSPPEMVAELARKRAKEHEDKLKEKGEGESK